MDDQQDDLVKKELRRNQEEADKQLNDALNAIFKKALHELNPTDKEFLYARRDIIGREQRNTYRGVFKEVEEVHRIKAEKEAKGEQVQNVEELFTNDHPGNIQPVEDDGEDEALG